MESLARLSLHRWMILRRGSDLGEMEESNGGFHVSTAWILLMLFYYWMKPCVSCEGSGKYNVCCDILFHDVCDQNVGILLVSDFSTDLWFTWKVHSIPVFFFLDLVCSFQFLHFLIRSGIVLLCLSFHMKYGKGFALHYLIAWKYTVSNSLIIMEDYVANRISSSFGFHPCCFQ